MHNGGQKDGHCTAIAQRGDGVNCTGIARRCRLQRVKCTRSGPLINGIYSRVVKLIWSLKQNASEYSILRFLAISFREKNIQGIFKEGLEEDTLRKVYPFHPSEKRIWKENIEDPKNIANSTKPTCEFASSFGQKAHSGV